MKKIFSLLALAIAAGAAFAQVDPNRTIVVVNGEEIKGGEYYHRMEYLTDVGRVMGNGGLVRFPPGFMTIEELISERLILQLAKKKGVYPTDVEVQAELKNRKEANSKLLENWLTSGQTEDDLMYALRVEIAKFKVATAGITVTDQEAEQFYKEHPNMYTFDKKVKLSLIAVSDTVAQKAVDDDLAAKKPFADVAKMRSEDVTKAIGGDFGEWYISELNANLRSVIDKVQIGRTTDWIKAGDRYVKFMLVDVTPPKLMELTPALKRSIRKQRMMDLGQVKNNVAKEMLELRKTAKIDIKDKVFADIYAKWIDAFMKDAALKGGGN